MQQKGRLSGRGGKESKGMNDDCTVNHMQRTVEGMCRCGGRTWCGSLAVVEVRDFFASAAFVISHWHRLEMSGAAETAKRGLMPEAELLACAGDINASFTSIAVLCTSSSWAYIRLCSAVIAVAWTTA